MDYVKKQHLEDQLQELERSGSPEKLRQFESDVHRDRVRAQHQLEGLMKVDEDKVSTSRSRANPNFEKARLAAEDEVHECCMLEREAEELAQKLESSSESSLDYDDQGCTCPPEKKHDGTRPCEL